MNSKPGTPTRIVAVDLARLAAIVFMVQGHTLDVLLASEYRQGAIFNGWLFLRGLTAPIFLVVAGCSFFLATARNGMFNCTDNATIMRRLARFSGFIAIGYIMHMPARSLSTLRTVDAAGFQSWTQVDVLQCIGITLIALQLLALMARTVQRFAVIAAVAAVLIVVITPLAWAVDGNRFLPPFLPPT